MKHLIKTADSSSLAAVNYNRVILNTTTDNVTIDYSYVDLGLSVKWAKCNIGAETETDYGDFFMWGSTTSNTASECTWANAPFNNGSDSYNETYFNRVKDTVCPNGILAKEYDTATQIMGSEWRMPTQTEWQELLNNTTIEWIADYNSTGVNGRKFTSKTNGNSIFIPAAGYCNDGSVNNVGGLGTVWSSSLENSTPYYAWSLNFSSVNCGMGSVYRNLGRSVRGVRA